MLSSRLSRQPRPRFRGARRSRRARAGGSRGDVVVKDTDIEDKENDHDEGERGRGA